VKEDDTNGMLGEVCWVQVVAVLRGMMPAGFLSGEVLDSIKGLILYR
jgi:hypothetical protein